MTAPATTAADVLVIFDITGDLAKKMTFRSLGVTGVPSGQARRFVMEPFRPARSSAG